MWRTRPINSYLDRQRGKGVGGRENVGVFGDSGGHFRCAGVFWRRLVSVNIESLEEIERVYFFPGQGCKIIMLNFANEYFR